MHGAKNTKFAASQQAKQLYQYKIRKMLTNTVSPSRMPDPGRKSGFSRLC